MSDQERVPKVKITLILYEDGYSRVKMESSDGGKFDKRDALYLLNVATDKLIAQETYTCQEGT
jgi:hypothetical protein